MIEEIQQILAKIEVSNGLHPADLCESPIEYRLLNHLEKYLKNDVELFPQYKVNTISGNFRLDFVFKSDTKIIGIECDGMEYHSKDDDDWYDEWRDTLILHHSDLTDIYRFRGKDIMNSISDLIYVLSKTENSFFNSDVDRIKPLVSDDNLELINNGDEYPRFNYMKWHSIFRMTQLIQVKQMSKRYDLTDVVRIKCILYSILNPNLKIPELIKLYKRDETPVEDLFKQVEGLTSK